MSKINRRDCLIGMGSTAGAIAASATLDLHAQNHPDTVEPANHKFQGDSGRTPKDLLSKIFVESGIHRHDLRSTESVKLVFHGLMGFALNSAGECEVGFHSRDSIKHRHKLTIMGFKTRETTCEDMFTKENVPPGAPLELEVIQPELDGVKFFQPSLTGGVMHENDFRWVTNLEGHDWYNTNLRPWQPNVYKPVMVVKNALFYTLMKTASTFRRQTLGQEPTPQNVIQIGHIAEYIGANIYLKQGGSVRLTVQGQTIPLPQIANVSYEIHFNNDCKKIVGTDSCVFNPYHPVDETERNDFYMHRDALNLGTGPRYQLVLAQPGSPTIPDICVPHRLNDEAPCSGAGYGGTGGFPPFP